MMRWPAFLLLTLVCASVPGASNSTRWKINLEQSQGLQSFDREISALWMIQQGVLFLTPDQVLVYQVNRAQDQVRLGPRDATGGAGNFVLNIRVFSVEDGHLLRALNLRTNGEISSVMATRGGGFLARTGSALSLYSADFEPVASREIPLEKPGRVENWQVRVSPSGAEVVLLHEEIITEAEVLSDNTVLHDGEARVHVEILDSGNLKLKSSFTLSHILLFWAPGDEVLVSSNPAHSYSDGQLGTLDFKGNWSPIRADFALAKSSCPYSVRAIDRDRVVLYGCETFTVLSMAGKRLFARNDGRYIFRSVAANGPYLAIACDHYRLGGEIPLGRSELMTRADRIEVYDLDRQSRLASVPVHAERAYYAVSPEGELVVVNGTTLELLQAGR